MFVIMEKKLFLCRKSRNNRYWNWKYTSKKLNNRNCEYIGKTIILKS